jgi:hypothetical protein
MVELKVQKTSGCELAVPNVEKRSKRRLARSHAGISYRRRGIENILASTGGLVGLLPLVGNKAKIQPSRFIKKVGKKKDKLRRYSDSGDLVNYRRAADMVEPAPLLICPKP